MIKAVIFDLNGVFIISPKLSERFEQDFNVPLDEFLPALKEIMDKVRLPGAEDLYDLWKPYFVKWNISLNEEEFLNYWFSAEKENTELTDLAKKLKAKGIQIIILSNNFRERAGYYEENFSFLKELFDGVYYSWQTGIVKPDVKAFDNILTKHNLKPEEVLYFDDSDKNIKVAETLGVESHIFDDSSIGLLKSLVTQGDVK